MYIVLFFFSFSQNYTLTYNVLEYIFLIEIATGIAFYGVVIIIILVTVYEYVICCLIISR